jgi:hypothetical protein
MSATTADSAFLQTRQERQLGAVHADHLPDGAQLDRCAASAVGSLDRHTLVFDIGGPAHPGVHRGRLSDAEKGIAEPN